MKIRINYDFFDKIKDAKEDKPTVFTVIRNNKKSFVLNIIIFNTLEFLKHSPILEHLINTSFFVSLPYLVTYFTALILSKSAKTNLYQHQANQDLLILLKQFRELCLNTDYNLLLQTELYKRKYKLEHNSDGIPYIIERKYYNIPVYDYKNNVTTKSVLEEHALGSNRYDLSIGEPKKKLKLEPITDYQ